MLPIRLVVIKGIGSTEKKCFVQVQANNGTPPGLLADPTFRAKATYTAAEVDRKATGPGIQSLLSITNFTEIYCK